ncbi:MAG: hypothetical protein QF666_06675 [Alphaproteobacteria bacterium]|jgi:hypothetical protein|nr:hypothetical protein [Alphaproteobacteria bacterium]
MPSILSKLAEYLPEWEKSADKRELEPEDGHEGLYQAAAAE